MGAKRTRFIGLTARLTGEMKVDDIPAAGWANTDALKEGDDDPLEVGLAVPAGKSDRPAFGDTKRQRTSRRSSPSRSRMGLAQR